MDLRAAVLVGDGHYVTAAAKKGYVFTCDGYAQRFGTDQGGAGVKRPWFQGATCSSKTKAAVRGTVSWTPRTAMTVAGGRRVIATNDQPKHTTGVFPFPYNPSDPGSPTTATRTASRRSR